MARMSVRETLTQPGFLLGCAGLALCLCVRDAYQFTLFNTMRGSIPAQHLISISRAVALLAVVAALVVARRRQDGRSDAVTRIGLAAACLGAALETAGLVVQIAFAQESADLAGIAALGLGQSLLVSAWVLWLLRQRQRRMFMAFIASFALAGAAEVVLSVMDATAIGFILPALPLASLALCLPSLRAGARTTEGASGPSTPAATACGGFDAQSPRRLVLTLITFFGYSFIARQLGDTWMEQLTDEPLMAFQLFASLGTLFAAGLVYLAFSLRRSYKNSAMYTVFVTFVVCVALYLSLTFTGAMGVLCLVPLFMLRKMLLFLTVFFAREFGSEGRMLGAFCVGMVSVELGNVFQTAFYDAVDGLPCGTAAGSLVILAFMVYTVIVEWSQFFRKGQADALPTVDGTGPGTAPDALAAAIARMSEESGLSAREAEVLACLAAGRNAEYVSRTLGVAVSTAKSHIAHIYRKTGYNSQQRLMDALEEMAEGE